MHRVHNQKANIVLSWHCLWTQAILPLYLAQQILTSCCSNTQRINMVLFGLFTAKGTSYSRWPQACLLAPSKTIVSWQSPLPCHASCWVLWAPALGRACPAWQLLSSLHVQNLMEIWCPPWCTLSLLCHPTVQDWYILWRRSGCYPKEP